jgi:ATP-dependent DNA helicase RecG
MPDRVLELVYTKYLKGLIRYKGIHRIDQYPVPHEAFREALLNAIVHKDYSLCNPIQIRIYQDRILMYSSGHLPPNWTTETLLGEHPSEPFNPLLATGFFHSGQMKACGRGIEKIAAACVRVGVMPPQYESKGNTISVRFVFEENYVRELKRLEAQLGGVVFF